MKLAGKKAFVTGGRTGIGRGIAEAFIEHGASVITCGRGTEATAENLPLGCEYVQLDVSNSAEVQSFAASLHELEALSLILALYLAKWPTRLWHSTMPPKRLYTV